MSFVFPSRSLPAIHIDSHYPKPLSHASPILLIASVFESYVLSFGVEVLDFNSTHSNQILSFPVNSPLQLAS